MNEQEIIDMAERAGVTVRGHYDESGSTPQELLRLAKLVAEKEREACAKVCESIYTNGDAAEGWLYIAADNIRARNNKDVKP